MWLEGCFFVRGLFETISLPALASRCGIFSQVIQSAQLSANKRPAMIYCLFGSECGPSWSWSLLQQLTALIRGQQRQWGEGYSPSTHQYRVLDEVILEQVSLQYKYNKIVIWVHIQLVSLLVVSARSSTPVSVSVHPWSEELTSPLTPCTTEYCKITGQLWENCKCVSLFRSYCEKWCRWDWDLSP